MLGKLSLILSTVFIFAAWYRFLEYTLIISLISSALIIIFRIISQGITQCMRRLVIGQIIYSFSWIIWLFLQHHEQLTLLMVLPLMLSTIGKFYTVMTPANKYDNHAVEQLIIFQSKLELGIFFYSLLDMIIKLMIMIFSQKPFQQTNQINNLILLLLLGIIVKVKYQLNYATQKAFRQLHFSVDRLMKDLNMRNLYHFLHWMMAVGSFTYPLEKIISY